MGFENFPRVLPDHFADMAAHGCVGFNTEPGPVGSAGELVATVPVQISDEARHVVQEHL
jgi:hypothetical protein